MKTTKMHIKEEKGFTGIDIAISVIIITIFIAIIANLISNINLTSEETKRKTIATSYAVQQMEIIKAQGYIENYEGKGINKKDTIIDEDIKKDGNSTGYHKIVTIKDYTLIKNDSKAQTNLVKEITVQISYKLAGKDENIEISTYIKKE